MLNGLIQTARDSSFPYKPNMQLHTCTHRNQSGETGFLTSCHPACATFPLGSCLPQGAQRFLEPARSQRLELAPRVRPGQVNLTVFPSAAALPGPRGPREPARSGWFPGAGTRAQAHVLVLPPVSWRASASLPEQRPALAWQAPVWVESLQ